MTLHEPDHAVVEGLPPGLAFDADRRSIEGTPTATGVWSALVEMQTGDEVIGQPLRFEILAPPPRLEGIFPTARRTIW